MAPTLRKTMKKTLIETDINAKVIKALTETDPKAIITYMAKNAPRTLVDIINRMEKGEASPTTHEPVSASGVRHDWAELKANLEELYGTGEYTPEQLVNAAMDLTEGEIDRYTAGMIVEEIFI